MKKALVLGAGGFIGSNMVKRLKSMGYWVRGVDLKYPEFEETKADDFVIGDLTDDKFMLSVLTHLNIYQEWDQVFNFCAWMGGSGVIFTGDNDSKILQNSAPVHINLLKNHHKFKKVFYSSSACAYNHKLQLTTENCSLKEGDIYPAWPDSVYGWEKCFAEIVYDSYRRNNNVDIRIARFHNIYGMNGTYTGGREKFPAAISRKVIEAPKNGTIEVWGTGSQTRSFCFIDDCIDGVLKLMDSDFIGPVNIGSEEMISINDLTKMVIEISGRTDLTIKNVDGPVGVNGRNSDNTLCREKLGWEPKTSLREGMEKLYHWIYDQINSKVVS